MAKGLVLRVVAGSGGWFPCCAGTSAAPDARPIAGYESSEVQAQRGPAKAGTVPPLFLSRNLERRMLSFPRPIAAGVSDSVP
jgi:hypothetical protein